jgi:hypothetical protein
MPTLTLLLTVTDVFAIPSRGLSLHPSPDMPAHGFKPRHCEATLEFPDGSTQKCTIALTPGHYRVVSGGSKWTVEVSLGEVQKNDVPLGTRVLVDEQVARELSGVPLAE